MSSVKIEKPTKTNEEKAKSVTKKNDKSNRPTRAFWNQQRELSEQNRRQAQEQLKSAGEWEGDKNSIWFDVGRRRSESVRSETRSKGGNNQSSNSPIRGNCWSNADKENINDMVNLFGKYLANSATDATLNSTLSVLSHMKTNRNNKELGNLLKRAEYLSIFYGNFTDEQRAYCLVVVENLQPHHELEEIRRIYAAAVDKDNNAKQGASRMEPTAVSEANVSNPPASVSIAEAAKNPEPEVDSSKTEGTIENEKDRLPVAPASPSTDTEEDDSETDSDSEPQPTEKTPLLRRRRNKVPKLPSVEEIDKKLLEVKRQREAEDKARLLRDLSSRLRKDVDSSKCSLPRRLYFERGNDVVIGTLSKVEEKCLDPRKKVVDVYDTYYLERFRRRGDKLCPVYDEYNTTRAVPIEINAAMLVSLAGKRWQARDKIGKQSLLCEGSESVYANLYEGKINLSKAYVVEILDIVFADDGAAVPYVPEYIRCNESTFSKETTNCGKIVCRDDDLNIDERALSLLFLPWIQHHVFPVTKKELTKTSWKRLLKGFIAENYYRLRDRFQEEAAKFKNIGGLIWSDADGYDFQGYARDCISRKCLPEVSSAEWMAAADQATDLLEEDPSGEKLLKVLFYTLRKQTHVFIKDEEYDKDDTTLRLIVAPHVFVKVVFGTVFRPVEETIYFHEESPLHGHLIKGKTQEEIKDMIMALSADDDGQIPEEELDRPVYAELDHSAFESSQAKESLNLEYSIYKSYYKPGSIGRGILNIVHAVNVTRGCMHNKFFTVLRDAMRWSGLNNTACGNAMMTAINLVVATGLSWLAKFLVEGDDIIVWMTRRILQELLANSIYPLTYEYSDRWSDLSFCGNHYDADGHRIMPDNETFCRKITTYFTRQPVSRHKAYELLYLRLMSAQLQYGAQPLMDTLIDEVNIQYSDVRHLGVRKKTIQQWYADNWYLCQGKLKHFKLPGDTTKVPNFHSIYDRVVQLSLEKGEVLRGKQLAEIASYAVECSMRGPVSKWKKWLATGALKLVFGLARQRSGRKTQVDASSWIESKRVSIVDYAASRSWYRKLARWAGVGSCMHSTGGSDPQVVYEQEFDTLRTEKYLRNYNRQVLEIRSFVDKAATLSWDPVFREAGFSEVDA